MASYLYGAYIDVDQTSRGFPEQDAILPIAPQKVLSRPYHTAQHVPDTVELDNMQLGTERTGPAPAPTTTPEQEIRTALNDLEMSRPATPIPENEIEALQSFSNPPINKFRVLSICFLNLGAGLNDGVPGVLIPYLQKDYNVGYALVSMIFVTNAIGYISSAFFIDAIQAGLGRSRTFILGCGVLACGYVIIICSPQFAVIAFSFYVLGFGRGVTNPLGNVWLVNLQNGTNLLGITSGSYGLGGTIGDLPWSRYYIICLSLAVFNAISLAATFWNSEKENSSTVSRLPSNEQNSVRHRSTTPSTPASVTRERFRSMLRALKHKTVLIGALFLFSYVGAETSISGWVTSFLITARKGDPRSIGYVTSGFWGGITIGRFLLAGPAKHLGLKTFVYAIVAGAAAFELLVWLVPNVIGDGVAVAVVGILLGPIFPCATTIFSRTISRSEQVSGLSLISAFGSSGGALAPFTTGILAQAVGTFVMHPIIIGLFATMMVCWFTMPSSKTRNE